MMNPSPTPGWICNPYELAVVGDSGAVVTELMARLDLVTARVDAQTLQGRRPPLSRLDHLEYDAVFLEGPVLGAVDRVLVIGDDGGGAPDDASGPWLACVGPTREAPASAPDVPYFCRDDAAALADFVRQRWKAKTAERPVFGLVLTGGKSTRMGEDKATLVYRGEEEARRVFALLQGFCQQVFVSCRADQAELPGRRGLPQVHDTVLGKGPLSGLLSAFEMHPDAAWLVTACDLPRLDHDVLVRLLDGRNPHRFATAFRGHKDLPEPLCALYEPKAQARLYQFLAAGYDCPRKMLINSPSKILEPLPGDRLANVNRPEERQEVLHDFRG